MSVSTKKIQNTLKEAGIRITEDHINNAFRVSYMDGEGSPVIVHYVINITDPDYDNAQRETEKAVKTLKTAGFIIREYSPGDRAFKIVDWSAYNAKNPSNPLKFTIVDHLKLTPHSPGFEETTIDVRSSDDVGDVFNRISTKYGFDHCGLISVTESGIMQLRLTKKDKTARQLTVLSSSENNYPIPL